MADPFVVRDTDGLSEARRAFRQAARDGEGHLEIELPATAGSSGCWVHEGG